MKTFRVLVSKQQQQQKTIFKQRVDMLTNYTGRLGGLAEFVSYLFS